jgi:hypothetical protein
VLKKLEREAIRSIAKRLGPSALGDVLTEVLEVSGLRLTAEGYTAAKALVQTGAPPQDLADLLLLQMAAMHRFDKEGLLLATLDEAYEKPLKTAGAWDLFWQGAPTEPRPEILRADDLLDLEIEGGQS